MRIKKAAKAAIKAGALITLAVMFSDCSSAGRTPVSKRSPAVADAGGSQALVLAQAQPSAREIVASKPRGVWVVLTDLESSRQQRKPEYCPHEYEVFYEPPSAGPLVWWVDPRVHRVTRPALDPFGVDWRSAKVSSTGSPFASDLDAEMSRIQAKPDPDPQLDRCLNGSPPARVTPER